jgi:hypothetical protein
MDEWGGRLRKIQHHGYNNNYRFQKDFWRKLGNLAKVWNHWGYQLKGMKRKKQRIKEYHTMDERLKVCLKYWRDNRRVKGWAQTFDNIRSNWRDRGRYIKGRKTDG